MHKVSSGHCFFLWLLQGKHFHFHYYGLVHCGINLNLLKKNLLVITEQQYFFFIYYVYSPVAMF